eukprot:COSAG06_NODE_1232_length_10153_cov_24.843246_15_plen_119_part_01
MAFEGGNSRRARRLVPQHPPAQRPRGHRITPVFAWGVAREVVASAGAILVRCEVLRAPLAEVDGLGCARGRGNMVASWRPDGRNESAIGAMWPCALGPHVDFYSRCSGLLGLYQRRWWN